MAGIDDLLNLVFRTVDVTPRYEPERCLVVTRASNIACRECVDACPHDAVRIVGMRIEIDPVDCTGCGLCVRACPSEALEQRVSLASAAPVRCSQVKGSAQSVECLAKLSAMDMLQLAGRDGAANLARGDCANCRIGGPGVPAAVAETADEASRLAETLGRNLTVNVTRTDRLDQVDPGRRISRREMLTGGLREASQVAADALGPIERLLPAGDAEPGLVDMPKEHSKKVAALRLADPAPETLVPFRLPRVADGCILCPLCTKACPTDALRRELGPDGGQLILDPERCVGCDACVPACPVKVVSMDDEITWAEVKAGEQVAYSSTEDRGKVGAVHR